MKKRLIIPGVDQKLLIKDAAKLLPNPSRRLFLRGAASLGALTILTGCDIVDEDSAENVLRYVSTFNDRVQAAIFQPQKLAPVYPESMVTKPFPFNAYYSEDEAPEIDGESYRLEVAGLVDNKKSWTLPELYALPQERQITRHICVEGWSAIGDWTGTRLSDFLKRVGADLTAKYVYFICKEGYSNTIDMPTALHPQTLMVFKFGNEILPRRYGYPMKIRMPTKLGYKNPKHVIAMAVTNEDRRGYWEDQGYNWFGGS
ncbi:MAG: molybdopterin-dependent oxidoreductase [Xanthobacteraceae bacterium]|nr:molybdopterin-dependent oxidoreductase [Xanthobacteraceae bacterium]